MRRTLVLALLAAACGGGGSAPTASSDVCPAYALRAAENAYVGIERGGPQSRYVKPEFIAGMSAQMLGVCKTLPVEHTRCVAKSTTSTEADLCPIEPATLQQLSADMQRIMAAELDRVLRLHASPEECAAAAVVQREKLAPAGIPLPSVEEFAAMCRAGADWTADYVRCVVATKDGDCKALPGVKADFTKLVQDHLATQ